MENNVGQVTLVRDINLGGDDGYSYGSDVYDLAVFKNKLYFTANDGLNGRELWISDGSTGGTQLIENINTGRTSSGAPRSSNPKDFTEANDKLFFTANNRVNGQELWVTDGTENGTQLVADINPGRGSSFDSYGSGYFAEANNKLFFSADDGTNGTELWVSDGTAAGTTLVKDINTGSSDGYYGTYPNSSRPRNLTEVNSKLFFSADNGTNGRELWVSDGTSAGTKLVKDINTGGGGSLSSYGSENFIEFNDKLYFAARNTRGRELWVSDGTSAGTKLVKDINPGVSNYGYTNSSSPSDFTEANNKLFFTATNSVSGRELWVSDGTSAGTKLVKDINPGSGGSLYSSEEFVEFNNKVFFSADDGTNGRELWVTDGTAAGTQLVKDINPGSSDGYYGTYPSSSDPSNFTEFNGKLYFTATDSANGTELWATDGTSAGTQLVADINPGSNGSGIGTLAVVGQELLFVADNGVVGRELFKLSFDNSTKITGTNSADSLTGSNSKNTIEGLNGNDTLSGLGGNDTLLGGNNNDSLLGGNGNDFIDGGTGFNTLTGGAGNDVFAVRSGSGSDTIADFQLGKDLIGLTGGVEFDDLTLSGNTIKSGSDLVATLTGVNTDDLTESNFTTI